MSASVFGFNQLVGMEGDPAFRGYFYGRSPDDQEFFLVVVDPGQQPDCRKHQQRSFPAHNIIPVAEVARERRPGDRRRKGN